MIPIATKDELKATLDERGVEYDDNASHDELSRLVGESNAPESSGDATTSGGLSAASLEQGAAASTFEPNDDAPEGSIAQVEVLPDE